VLILRAPGTNCDAEAAFAFEKAGAVTERLHVNALRETPALLRRFQILVLPAASATATTWGPGKSSRLNSSTSSPTRFASSATR